MVEEHPCFAGEHSYRGRATSECFVMSGSVSHLETVTFSQREVGVGDLALLAIENT
jgi:hypothetical protein